MSLQYADNIRYEAQKQNFERDGFKTVLDMLNFPETSLPPVFHAMVEETGKLYTYDVNNEVDTELGKWREAGSASDGKVKMTSTDLEAKYLEEFIDKQTLEIDTANNVLKAKTLDGLEVTIATLNFIKNLDKDIMDYIKAIGNPMSFKGVLDNDDALNAITKPSSGDTYIVTSSAENDNKTMTFVYDGTVFKPIAETKIEVRDFKNEPIDLASEVTGVLPKDKIDEGIARLVDVLTKEEYKGSEDGVVKSADTIKGLLYTILQLNDAIKNSHTHDNIDNLIKIISTGSGSKFLADNGEYQDILIIQETEPTESTIFWIDTTDETAPLLKFNNGTNWVTISASGNTDNSITIDTVMSDISTNPVQNNVIKKYIDDIIAEIGAGGDTGTTAESATLVEREW